MEVPYGVAVTTLPQPWASDVDHVCKKCGFTSDSATFLFIHSRDCKKDYQLFECSKCKKFLKSRRAMEYHMKTKHCKTSRKYLKFKSERYECDLCKKVFKHKCLIQEHMLIHHLNVPYSCDLCDKQFKNKSKFHEHIKKVHLGVNKEPKKNFACPYCPLKFRTSQYLSDHQHVHTGFKMYECDICHKGFFIKGSLQSHIRAKHKTPQPQTNELVMRVTCDICGKSYSHKRGLDYHYRVHHGDGKLTCNICGKKVCEKRSLIIHMNTHSGEKPYCCDICGRSFTTKAYLKVHSLTHTGETPHVCHICTKSFTQRSSLTLHYRTHHPGVTPSTLAKYKKT